MDVSEDVRVTINLTLKASTYPGTGERAMEVNKVDFECSDPSLDPLKVSLVSAVGVALTVCAQSPNSMADSIRIFYEIMKDSAFTRSQVAKGNFTPAGHDTLEDLEAN